MPGGRPSVNFESYKDQITEYWISGWEVTDTSNWLLNSEGLKHGYLPIIFHIPLLSFMTIKTTANATSRKRTLERKLKEWNLTRYKQNDDDSILRIYLLILYQDLALSDEEILIVLQSEGYTIQDWKLKQIRKDMGFFTKVQGVENLEESNT